MKNAGGDLVKAYQKLGAAFREDFEIYPNFENNYFRIKEVVAKAISKEAARVARETSKNPPPSPQSSDAESTGLHDSDNDQLEQTGGGKPAAKRLPEKAPPSGPKKAPPSSVQAGAIQNPAVSGSQAQSSGRVTGGAHGENQMTFIFDLTKYITEPIFHMYDTTGRHAGASQNEDRTTGVHLRFDTEEEAGSRGGDTVEAQIVDDQSPQKAPAVSFGEAVKNQRSSGRKRSEVDRFTPEDNSRDAARKKAPAKSATGTLQAKGANDRSAELSQQDSETNTESSMVGNQPSTGATNITGNASSAPAGFSINYVIPRRTGHSDEMPRPDWSNLPPPIFRDEAGKLTQQQASHKPNEANVARDEASIGGNSMEVDSVAVKEICSVRNNDPLGSFLKIRKGASKLLHNQKMWDPNQVKPANLEQLAFNCQAESIRGLEAYADPEKDWHLYNTAVYQRAFFQLWHLYERAQGRVRYFCVMSFILCC